MSNDEKGKFSKSSFIDMHNPVCTGSKFSSFYSTSGYNRQTSEFWLPRFTLSFKIKIKACFCLASGKELFYFTTARKSGNILLTYEKLFSSDTHQSMKMSDSDLKVNRNIYPDAVTCDRMRLIGPKCDQLGPINIVYLKSPNEKTSSFCLHKTGFESLDVNRFQNT